jgi:ribonuclease T2
MTISHPIRAILALLLVGGAAALPISSAPARNPCASAARFDYYLMSLSWSPSYCLAHPDESEQCSSKGFGFVLHGLWPEYRSGSGPQHCRANGSPGEATIARTLAFMPSRRLIEHEWQTHGACTGLDAKAYFDLADRAFASVAIPAELQAPRFPPALSATAVVRAFTRANPGLDDSMLGLQCHDGYELTEVRVCLNKDTLSPQACGGRVRNSCRYGTLKIPAVR